MTLTFDQRTYLRAARYNQLFENASGRPVIQANKTSTRVLRVNAKISVVEQLRAAGWIALDTNSRYQLTDSGKAVWESL